MKNITLDLFSHIQIYVNNYRTTTWVITFNGKLWFVNLCVCVVCVFVIFGESFSLTMQKIGYLIWYFKLLRFGYLFYYERWKPTIEWLWFSYSCICSRYFIPRISVKLCLCLIFHASISVRLIQFYDLVLV